MKKTGLAVAITVLVFVGFLLIFNQVIDSQEKTFKEMQIADFQESPRKFTDSLVMEDPVFWKLIEDAKAAEPSHFESQMLHLTKELSKLPNTQIVAFERALREKTILLWNYNVKSLFQIIFGKYFSTDGFLYFRLWIISNGEDMFHKAINNPDELAAIIEKKHDGEKLMTVADRAFEQKNGRSHNLIFPRDLAQEVDYDLGNFKMSGGYISLDDFERAFPNLSEKF